MPKKNGRGSDDDFKTAKDKDSEKKTKPNKWESCPTGQGVKDQPIKQQNSDPDQEIGKSIKSTRTSDPEHKGTHRSRRVKFAERLVEQRMYDRTASPNAETILVTDIKPAPKTIITSLEELQPPLSLVAQMDLAARKLGARDLIPNAQKQTVPKSIQPASSQRPSPSTAASRSPQDKAKQQSRQQNTHRQRAFNDTNANKYGSQDDHQNDLSELSRKTTESNKSKASIKTIASNVNDKQTDHGMHDEDKDH